MSANPRRPASKDPRSGPDRVEIEEAAPEQIENREDVREALRQTATEGRTRPVAHTGDRVFLAIAGIALVLLVSFYVGLARAMDLLAAINSPMLRRGALAAMLIAAVLVLNRLAVVFVISRIESAVAK